jgi:probable F420-dependent oxidoreductase
MVQLGLVLPDELYNIDLQQTLHLARTAETAGFSSLWKGETSGMNSLMVLSATAQETSTIRLGTGIANVFSRSPALLGMSGATLDRLSGGRGLLGLGVSSPPLVETWHGQEFVAPLRRMRETIEIVRQTLDGGTLEYKGKIYEVGPYSVGVAAESESVPIFNAAMGETNRRLTGEYADGWMPVFVPHSRIDEYVDEVAAVADEAGRERPTMAPWIPLSMADHHEEAKSQARLLLAQEMAMGYNELVRKYGYGDSADEAFERWRAGDREHAAAAIPDEMLDEFTVYGTPEACLEGLRSYVERGVDLPIIWLPFASSLPELTETIEFLGSTDLP